MMKSCSFSKGGAILLLILALSSCSAPAGRRAFVRIARTDGTVTVDTIVLSSRKGVLEYNLPQGKLEGVDTISITPEFSIACAGDEGFYVNSQGILTRFLEGRSGRYSVFHRHPMPIAGAKTPQGCWLAYSPNYRFDTGVTVRCRDGKYSQTFSVVPFNHEPYADLLFRWFPLKGKDATYAGMGRLYRKIRLAQGGLVPLREKVKERPLLQYAVDYPEIRIRQGWKPVPCSVPHQTLENEPPMRVAVTFDKVCEIIDEMKAQGVPGAQLTLVGWNIRGHDGRFPTIFPPDPELGGEEGLKHLISYAQENGFQIVPHICTGDAYEISSDFDLGDVALLPDGTRYSKFVYGGGKMFELCYEQSYKKFVVPFSDSLSRMGFKGIAYNDVYSIVAPHACTDPNHRNNPEQAAEWARKTLRKLTETMGGAASEGGYDHLSSDLDFALYISMLGPTTLSFKKLCDEYVPIWHIVYNGYIYSCPFSRSVNYTIKEPAFAMKMQEYGGHPTFYFYSAHRHDDRNWIGTPDCDLLAASPEDVTASVDAIRKGWEYMKEYGYIQYLTMDDHEQIAPDIFKTTFSDGTVTICNYSKEPFQYRTLSVPAEDWRIIKGKDKK